MVLCSSPVIQISPSHSLSSVDLNNTFFSYDFPSVLSESLTMDSLSTVESSIDIPSFPSGHRPPITSIVSLGSCLSMFPRGLRRLGGLYPVEDVDNISITIPTAPRLKAMLKEDLCIRRWAENLSPFGAPGHSPWGELANVPVSSWVPEGSNYPPDVFQEALRSKRQVSGQNTWNVSLSPPSPEISPALCLPNQSRNPLVFEQEIKFNSGGKPKKWSLHVPAHSMDPEMVDMVLQLQKLNSFFRDGLEDPEQPAGLHVGEKPKLVPPTLVVSNSESSMPILFNSAGEPPQTLAVRRGKAIPPMLSVRSEVDRSSYSSIPSAFLGSPSTYSPKFEFANRAGQPSMDFEDMVISLRNQCASFPGRSPCASEHDVTANVSHSFHDDDDWAFAHTLLENHTKPHVDPDFRYANFGQSHWSSSSKDDLALESPIDSNSEFSSFSLDQTQNTSIDSSSAFRSYKSNRPSNCTPPHGPPSTPLPAPPILAPKSPKLMRGILKSCKSVHFASLPTRHEAPTPVATPPVTAPGRLARTSIVPSLRRPSPLRASHSPDDSTPSRASHAVLVSSSTLRTPKRKAVPEDNPTSPPVPASNQTTTSTGYIGANLPFRRPTTKQTNSPEKTWSRQTASSTGRRSFGRFTLTPPAKGKENKAAFPRWSTLNENVLRRESNTSQRDCGSKSRMGIPLRSIFTRFK